MPMYTLKCDECGEVDTRLCPVDERHLQTCELCKAKMTLQPSTCSVKWNCSTDTASNGKEPR
jgi:predicted nucleic acid-binding Zn ribbon protein